LCGSEAPRQELDRVYALDQKDLEKLASYHLEIIE
jgi:hypothetical protein